MIVFSSPQSIPATATVSFDRLKQLGFTSGKWVEVRDQSSNIYYCRIWPALVPFDHVIVDDFIHKKGTASTLQVALTQLEPVTAVQAQLEVSIKKGSSHQDQIQEFGFVFDQGTSLQKMETIRSFVDGMVVTTGMTLCRSSSTPSSTLSIKVVSVFPNDKPGLMSSGTRIEYVYTNKTTTTDPAKSTDLDQIDQAMESLTLTSDTDDNKPLVETSKPSGLEKAYDSLIEMVSYPFIYQDWIDTLGIECPKGILLYGPPGVGKTFLVSSVSKTYDAQLMVIQGPELYGPYVGESEAKLRQRFEEARQMTLESNKPVILFIDEIDALTPHREQAQSHESRMVAQLLTLMDGVKSRGKLIVVGATNRPNAIDPALRRPGRFDREISVDAPDVTTRKKLITSQLRTMPIDPSVNIDLLAQYTNGFVAADITSMCREAALSAVHKNQTTGDRSVLVAMDDFKAALTKVGPSMQRGFKVSVEATRWEDVGGLQDVKKQLKQAVEWPLIHKDAFNRLGLRPPRGILLYGPPGCSKTTLVKVIASSSGASFLSINGAQLYSPYVGDSEKVVRTTFQKARASAPAIIFLDETEAIVGKRNMGNGGSGGDSVQERILSTLLNEMDGVESAESVLVVGATNRPDMLDAALMRPGRFDRLIYVPPPDDEARLEILQIHTRQMPLADDVDLTVISLMTDMYTGADLQNVCREAAMMALRRDPYTQLVNMADFEESLATIPPSITETMLASYKPEE